MRRVYLKRSAIVARGNTTERYAGDSFYFVDDDLAQRWTEAGEAYFATDDNQAIMPPEPEPEPEPDHFSDDAAPPTPVPPEVAAELELD
jgi:hypothetical protein